MDDLFILTLHKKDYYVFDEGEKTITIALNCGASIKKCPIMTIEEFVAMLKGK